MDRDFALMTAGPCMELPRLRHDRLLTTTEDLEVYDSRCYVPRSGYKDREGPTVTEVVIPRRGVFAAHGCGKEILGNVGCVVLIGAHEDYSVAHPGADWHAYTYLRVHAAVIEESFGPMRFAARSLDRAQMLAVSLIANSMRSGQWDDLEAEELAMLLLAAVVNSFGTPERSTAARVGAQRTKRIQRICAMLAAAPTEHWRLQSIGRQVACSPFHLARDFRAVTGETIGRYLLRLRLGVALDRVAGGAEDLAALASDIGFAHHSHFTYRFHQAFGLTPTDARRLLSERRLEAFRVLLSRSAPTQADARGGSDAVCAKRWRPHVALATGGQTSATPS